MALIEFTSHPSIACESLVVCLNRHTEKSKLQRVMRDLGWVGFELMTLDAWVPASSDDITSTHWLYLSMEV